MTWGTNNVWSLQIVQNNTITFSSLLVPFSQSFLLIFSLPFLVLLHLLRRIWRHQSHQSELIYLPFLWSETLQLHLNGRGVLIIHYWAGHCSHRPKTASNVVNVNTLNSHYLSNSLNWLISFMLILLSDGINEDCKSSVPYVCCMMAPPVSRTCSATSARKGIKSFGCFLRVSWIKKRSNSWIPLGKYLGCLYLYILLSPLKCGNFGKMPLDDSNVELLPADKFCFHGNTRFIFYIIDSIWPQIASDHLSLTFEP